MNVVVIVAVRQMSQWENEFCREMKPMKKYKIASCCLCLIPVLVMSGDKFDINQHISFIGMEWRGNEMRKRTRMTLALVMGFGLAILSMALTIYFGYVHAYSNGGNIKDVYLFGLKIYRLTMEGDNYTGTSLGVNMGIVCAIYMGIALLLEEIIHKLRAGALSFGLYSYLSTALGLPGIYCIL